ncbi:MAG: Ldh family oxidoreductase, partial [Pseudomonadota bacterium]
GWAVDAEGAPTTDANAALAGSLLPLGGAKGAALALMVEVMAAALTGSNFAFEASSFLDDKGAAPGVGQLLIAIDPGAFAGRELFLDRVAALVAAIESDPGARLPGSRRMALRDRAERDGVVVDAETLASIRALSAGH